jgi:N utilization substance protein A
VLDYYRDERYYTFDELRSAEQALDTFKDQMDGYVVWDPEVRTSLIVAFTVAGLENAVVVTEDQLSLAIGKRGQNVRLAARLTGWDIDILTPAEFNNALDTMEKALRDVEDVDSTVISQVVAMGMVSVLDVEEVGPDPLVKELEMDRDIAQRIVVRCAEEAKRVAAEEQRAKQDAEQSRHAAKPAQQQKQDAKDEQAPSAEPTEETADKDRPQETPQQTDQKTQQELSAENDDRQPDQPDRPENQENQADEQPEPA